MSAGLCFPLHGDACQHAEEHILMSNEPVCNRCVGTRTLLLERRQIGLRDSYPGKLPGTSMYPLYMLYVSSFTVEVLFMRACACD